jgi:23S rRNA pseudouridine955/2504/2580 synthase
MTVTFVVDDADAAGVRADRALRERYPNVDRTLALKLLKEGRLRINGQVATLALRAKAGQSITADIAEARLGEARIPIFSVVHEGAGVVVVDKAAGVVMHEGGAEVDDDDVLSAALAERFEIEPGFMGPSFLGRLDRATSGLVVAALTRAALVGLEPAWRDGRVHKEYLAIVHGKAPDEGVIDIPLAARGARKKGTGAIEEAKTGFKTLASTKRGSIVLCQLFTGRTHQVRRHMKAIGHPLLGDPRYGDARRDRDAPAVEGLMLHAWRLRHDGTVPLLPTKVTAPVPPRFRQMAAGFALDIDAALAAEKAARKASTSTAPPSTSAASSPSSASTSSSALTLSTKAPAPKAKPAKVVATATVSFDLDDDDDDDT